MRAEGNCLPFVIARMMSTRSVETSYEQYASCGADSYPEALCFFPYGMTYNLPRSVGILRSHAVGFDANLALSQSQSAYP